MRTMAFPIVLLFALAASGPARALDAKTPMVCALTDVFDCSGDECVEVVAEAVNVPDLLRLDPKAKTLRALDVELAGSGSKLDSVTDDHGKLGAHAHEGDRVLMLSVDEATGEAFFTVNDLHLSLVAYGTCGKL